MDHGEARDENGSAALEARLAALEAQVATLRAQLDGGAGRTAPVMKNALECPCCGGRKILHAARVLDRGDADAPQPMAVMKPSVWRSRVFGEFEVYICLSCGLTEWYVKDVKGLAVGAALDPETFRVIEAGHGGSGSGYR